MLLLQYGPSLGKRVQTVFQPPCANPAYLTGTAITIGIHPHLPLPAAGEHKMFPDKSPHTLHGPGKGSLPKSQEHPSPGCSPWQTPLESCCPLPSSAKTWAPVQRVMKQAGKETPEADVTQVCNITMSPEKINEGMITHCFLLCKN